MQPMTQGITRNRATQDNPRHSTPPSFTMLHSRNRCAGCSLCTTGFPLPLPYYTPPDRKPTPIIPSPPSIRPPSFPIALIHPAPATSFPITPLSIRHPPPSFPITLIIPVPLSHHPSRPRHSVLCPHHSHHPHPSGACPRHSPSPSSIRPLPPSFPITHPPGTRPVIPHHPSIRHLPRHSHRPRHVIPAKAGI